MKYFHSFLLVSVFAVAATSCRSDSMPEPEPEPETFVRARFQYIYNADNDSTLATASFDLMQGNSYISPWAPGAGELTFNGAAGQQDNNLFYYENPWADSVNIFCNSTEGVYDYLFPSTDTIIYRLPIAYPNLSLTTQNWFAWSVPQVTSDPLNDYHPEMVYVVIKQDSIVEYVLLQTNAAQIGWSLDANTDIVAGPAFVQVRYEKNWEDLAQAAGRPLYCTSLFKSEYVPVTIDP